MRNRARPLCVNTCMHASRFVLMACMTLGLSSCSLDGTPKSAPTSSPSLATSAAPELPNDAPGDPDESPAERRSKSFVGEANERLGVGESAELFIGVHCGLRYATIDGSGWEVVKENRGFSGGTPLIEGVATRVSSTVVVFESDSLRKEITLRPGERPRNFVCF